MLLEGNVSVKAAILGNHRKVEKLYYDKHKNDKDLNFILHRAKEKGIPCMPLEREEINAMATGRTHGGLVAQAGPRVYQELSECIYSAGCDGLILHRHDWSSAESTIAKSSAGAFEYMNIVMSDDLPQLVKDIKKQGVKTYAAMRKDAITYLEADYRNPCLLAIGGEMRGLSSAVRNEIEQNIYIPYANDFRNALNAASAAAVLSFEVYRQRR